MTMDSGSLISSLMRHLARTQDQELDCGEVFRVMDEYAENVVAGKDAAALLPLVKQHLDLCPDCIEEFEALLRILEARL